MQSFNIKISEVSLIFTEMFPTFTKVCPTFDSKISIFCFQINLFDIKFELSYSSVYLPNNEAIFNMSNE